MPNLEVRLSVHDAPGSLTTYGSIWKIPRKPGDKPVLELVPIRPGPGTKVKLLSGSYRYYFTFTGQQDDDEFMLQMKHVKSPAPPPMRKAFKTKPANDRSFRFVV